MSSDRLKELQRQRALAQEQLAWFDREIARETAGQVVTPAVANTAPIPPPGPVLTPPGAAPADAEHLIEQYRDSSPSIKGEVRRGCFLYFFAAFALLGLGIVAFYLLWRR